MGQCLILIIINDTFVLSVTIIKQRDCILIKRLFRRARMKRLKVLFHINEIERWDTALGNIINLLKDAGEDAVDAVVLGNGPSINAYGNETKLSVMKGLSERGVRFLACRNSLRKMCSSGDSCIAEDALSSFIEVVPAGITAIIRIQSDGYAYVKP